MSCSSKSTYMIVHCKHEGCYLDRQNDKLDSSGMRICPITINLPKIFLFNNKPEAKEFLTEYINDVDVVDQRCRVGQVNNGLDEEIKHINHCTCGIIELDEEDGQPILFYNAKHQIFFLEPGPQVFTPSFDLKMSAGNLNVINSLIRDNSTLDNEQRKRYIELGKRCEKYDH
jgi:hypothetical protein